MAGEVCPLGSKAYEHVAKALGGKLGVELGAFLKTLVGRFQDTSIGKRMIRVGLESHTARLVRALTISYEFSLSRLVLVKSNGI